MQSVRNVIEAQGGFVKLAERTKSDSNISMTYSTKNKYCN